MPSRAEEVSLAHDAGAPRTARRFLHTLLTSWGHSSEAIDRAQLLASELVSNAVLHGGPPITMAVHGDVPTVGCVRVEVTNGGHGTPIMRVASDHDPSGRGLRLIDDLSARWGAEHAGDQTMVWFELGAEQLTPPTG